MKGFRILISIAFGLLMIWMLTYEMFVSFVYSTAILWTLLPSEKKKGWKGYAILLLTPLVVWNVGLIEYGLKSIDLHCRVAGYFKDKGVEKPDFCVYQPNAYMTGVNHREGPLFSTTEHIGVHGFNIMLATGGFLTGLHEVAWETLYMSFAKDPVAGGIVNASKAERQRQCVGGEKTQKVDTSRGNGDWMFTSKKIRQMVAKNRRAAEKVTTGKPHKFTKKSVDFIPSTPYEKSDNGYYGALLKEDNLRVPLTLVVPDGVLTQEAMMTPDGPMIDVMWKGTISYPPNEKFAFPLPTLLQLKQVQSITKQTGPFPLLVSEGIFCGMTLDGAMNPYTQIWQTKISPSDDKLSDTGMMESEKGWIEFLLNPILK